MMKSVQVTVRSLEQSYHTDLKQFKNGETYKMSDLMNALSRSMPRLRIGGNKQ